MSSSIDPKPQQRLQRQSDPQSLRRTFRKLKNYTSTLANFVLQWQDLEDHFLSIKTKLEHLEETTLKSNTQLSLPSQDDSPIRENKSKHSIQSENKYPEKLSIQSQNGKNPERKIQDCKTKPLSQSQIENPESDHNDPSIKPSKISSSAIDNGKSLLLFFIEHVKQQDVLRNAIFETFKDLSNPGKLVLEALTFFYPTNSSKLEVGSHVNVNRKSCVVFLEELDRVGCLVESQEREEALNMALEWERRMKNSLEVLGFLMLVAVFGLVDEFDKDETFKYFDNVVQHDQAPQLFRTFGFEDKAHDFILRLIDKNKRVEAVPFIYEFELVEKFPPVPLLRAHSEYAEHCYRKICNKGNNSSNALDNATGIKLAALKGILKLVEKYKLQSQYSPKIIRMSILQLKKHKSNKKPTKSSPNPVVQPRRQIGNKRTAPGDDQLNQHNTSKRLQTVVPTSTSAVSINATTSSKPQSYYQEAGSCRSTDRKHFPLPSGNTAAVTNVTSASVSTSLTSHLMQSSHMHMAHFTSGQGAQNLIPSFGPYDLLSSSTFSVPRNSTNRLYGAVSSVPSTLSISLTAGQYGSSSSIPVTHQFTSSVGPHGSMAWTSFNPRMNQLNSMYRRNGDSVYHRNVTNGDTGQLRSAGFSFTNFCGR